VHGYQRRLQFSTPNHLAGSGSTLYLASDANKRTTASAMIKAITIRKADTLLSGLRRADAEAVEGSRAESIYIRQISFATYKRII
jgi:hypothetical protein